MRPGWLFMGGGGMLAVFPYAYAILLPAAYPLVIAMLLGLILHGVAFEFRTRDPRRILLWERAFMIGSFLATMMQGMILGTILQGIKVENNAYAGAYFDWLTPFTLLTGLSLVMGYVLLGAAWLIWRTDGSLQGRAKRAAPGLAWFVLAAMAVVCIASVTVQDIYLDRWLSFPKVIFAFLIPIGMVLAGLKLIRSIDRSADHVPFMMAIAIFLLGFAGLGISIFPDFLPPSLTIQQAAAPRPSLSFLLVGAAIIVPIILAYTGWAYWVFRGKTRIDAKGYH
ncbi:MAG: cytochrome d ubiquinol oxidase subunit II [Paracoccus sp. (in: a-proteobacteria)]